MTEIASERDTGTNTHVPVVAIGASAGGLEQVSALLAHMPAETGAAFVVVQHLAPSHVSQLPELLARATTLPVVTIEDNMALQADRVYVMPAGHDLGIEDDLLKLHRSVSHETVPTVIDRFFRKLAEARGSEAIGIILSGSGSDGALGIKAIKASGGLTMAQNPDNAEHDGMPRAAIQTSVLDFVRDTVDLIEPLTNHLRLNSTRMHGPRPADGKDDTENSITAEQLDSILKLLRQYNSRDHFACYKPRMLKRRILRRMGLAAIHTVDGYIERLKEESDERARLTQDFLISVTDFFREPATYKTLEEHAIQPLLKERSVEYPLRIWVPGCATGEEAYSIAILVSEAIQASGKDFRYTIFASDIDRAALDVARTGLYPESIREDIGDQRLRGFFDKVDSQYQIKRVIREQIVFTSQNLIDDPPFSRLDLISCRNLLMYLKPETQKQVISTFHFALKSDGFLFLGNSETLSGQVDLFEPVVNGSRLFRRMGPDQRGRIPQVFYGDSAHNLKPTAAHASGRPDTVENIARDVLLRDHVPAAVLVNRALDILCSYGPTDDYFNLPFGQSSLNIVDMVREPFRSHVRAVTHRAFTEGHPNEVTSTLEGRHGGNLLNIRARPIKEPSTARGLVLVTFERVQRAASNQHKNAYQSDVERQLGEELEDTRAELTSTIRALEAANEDLKSSSEEVMSMNEELQSTNEELETSKEELQSLNEELITVNSELEAKVDELERAHNDLSNLFSGTQIATLFLDRTLCIKRFTPAIKQLLSLINSDIGRPLTDITMKFSDPDLVSDADEVISELSVREREVQAENDRWYLRRVLPYRTRDNSIDGVVITFTDITDLKRALLTSQASEQRLDLAMDAINGGMWEMQVDPDNPGALPDQIYMSPRLKRLMGFEDRQLANSLQAWQERVLPEDRKAFVDKIPFQGGAADEGLQYRIRHRDGSIRWFASHGRLVEERAFGTARWVGIDRDITDLKYVDSRVRHAQWQLQLLADALPTLITYIDTDRVVCFSNAAQRQWFEATEPGVTLAQALGNRAYRALAPYLDSALAGRTTHCQLQWNQTQQDKRLLHVSLVPHHQDQDVVGLYILMADINDPERRGEVGPEEEKRLIYIQRMATLGEMASTLAHDMGQPLSAIGNYAGALTRMLHAGKPADATTEIVRRIAEQVQLAGDIIEQTRGLVGRQETGNEKIDINELVRQATALMESNANRMNVDMRVATHASIPTLTGHPVQIEQVLINLIRNALDAMETVDEDRRTLRVTTEQPDDAHVRVTVSDTGEGIPPNQISAIFDSFHSTKLKGMGMGLAISRTVINWHDGELWAESRLGEGATFIFDLPLTVSDDKQG
ncbi:chemotaxis protein CheB [Salinisphaera sp. LB1]|uniref:chemotaxis protein CheB n=1 Tax=Salinisphaera sp. LB1 TaxID=2183911 RepID=UPI000D708C46|nr:chemotaxis protein CheB [Salinisphaera sp. LB1]AWN16616.1 Chemotaxis protein methyltransferase CheR [Salinisphaera sp. LB1]